MNTTIVDRIIIITITVRIPIRTITINILIHTIATLIITSRILIVDLLTGIADPVDIEGLLVAHAEAVTEQSTEAFIVRIYRTQKQWGGAAAGKGPRRSALSPRAGFMFDLR